MLGTKRKDDFEPYWQDEKDRLCIVEFLPTDDPPEARLFAAGIIGYLVGYANLTNTRSLALLGDSDASAYELLFSFSSPEEKNEFLSLVRLNEDMGNDYIIELTPPTAEEIRNARPLPSTRNGPTPGCPHPCHAMLIAATLCVGAEEGSGCVVTPARTTASKRFRNGWTELSDDQERGSPTSDADQGIGQIREENAALTESLADVTYWKSTVLIARSPSFKETQRNSSASLSDPGRTQIWREFFALATSSTLRYHPMPKP